jgi:hypothetical protein
MMTDAHGNPGGSGGSGGSDPLDRLSTAGFDLGMFDDEQLELLGDLSEEELRVLLDIKERLGEVIPEVEAHSATPMTIGGLLF